MDEEGPVRVGQGDRRAPERKLREPHRDPLMRVAAQVKDRHQGTDARTVGALEKLAGRNFQVEDDCIVRKLLFPLVPKIERASEAGSTLLLRAPCGGERETATR